MEPLSVPGVICQALPAEVLGQIPKTTAIHYRRITQRFESLLSSAAAIARCAIDDDRFRLLTELRYARRHLINGYVDRTWVMPACELTWRAHINHECLTVEPLFDRRLYRR